jgi:hypothetical protein
MKTPLHLLTLAAAICSGLFTATAAEKDGHTHKTAPGGGRLLEKTEPHAELVVGKDRRVTINFYNEQMKPIAAAGQTVTVIAEARTGKETLQFEKKGDSLVSKTRLPEGEGYNVVVQFKQTAESKPQNIRFKLDLHPCGECQRPEYACICDH